MRYGGGKGRRSSKKVKFTSQDVCGDIHVRIPAPYHNALRKVLKDNGISQTDMLVEAVCWYLEKHMEREDYESLVKFVEDYYPPYKSKEVVEYWERLLGVYEE